MPNLDAAAPRVLNVARAIRECGHEVSFLSWGGGYRDQDLCADKRYRIDGFEYIITGDLPTKGGWRERLMTKLHRGDLSMAILRKMETQPEVVIMYNAELRQTRKLIRYCRTRNIKLVNDITEWFAPNELHLIDRKLYAVNMEQQQKQVPNKIAISTFLKDYYSQNHSIVIPATCDGSEEKWGRSANAAIPSFDGITLIYAGDSSRKDLLSVVISAVQRLRAESANIRFLIFGTTKDSFVQNNQDCKACDCLDDNIIFLGRVPQDDIPSYYKAADFMVLLREHTRKSEAGFPTKFAEAITSGTPVIANITSDLGNYLEDGVNGFVVPNPTEQSIYDVLREKVIPLSREQVNIMKGNTQQMKTRLDYRTFVEPMRDFLEHLRSL